MDRLQVANGLIPQAISDKKKNELLMNYSLMMQKKRQEDEERRANAMFQF